MEIVRNAVKCNNCKQELISLNRVEDISCSCKEITIGGGDQLVKRIDKCGQDCYEELLEFKTDPAEYNRNF